MSKHRPRKLPYKPYEKYEADYQEYEDYSWRNNRPKELTTDKVVKVTSVIKKRNGFLIKNVYGQERWMTFFEKLLYKWFGKTPRF